MFSEIKTKTNNLFEAKFFNLVLLTALLLILVWAGKLLWNNQKLEKQIKADKIKIAELQKANPADENAALIKKVGAIIVLPENEQPTIATVTDIAKLQDQPFFAKAQNGDKVLIYSQAKLAILYRPSENKVINTGPLTVDAAAVNSTTKK